MFGRKTRKLLDSLWDMVAHTRNTANKTREVIEDFDMKIELLRDEIRGYRREVERLQKSTQQSLLVIDKGQIKPLLMVMDTSNPPVGDFRLGEAQTNRQNFPKPNGVISQTNGQGAPSINQPFKSSYTDKELREATLALAGPKGKLP